MFFIFLAFVIALVVAALIVHFKFHRTGLAILAGIMLFGASPRTLPAETETSATLTRAVFSEIVVSDAVTVPAVEVPAPAKPFLVAGSLAADSGSVSARIARAFADANPPSEVAVIVLFEGDAVPTDAADIVTRGTTFTFASDGAVDVSLPVTPQTTPRTAHLVFVGIRHDAIPTE